MAGRPRTVDDARILRAVVDVMGRTGPAGLTLAAVAREVGLAPATLVQRFGSKRGMLLALAEHGVREAAGAVRRITAAHASPLAALDALFTEAAAPLADPEAYAHHLAFLCADLTDPEFLALARAVQGAEAAAVRELLGAAERAGELAPGADPEVVRAAVTGAGLLWAVDRAGTLAARRRAALDAVLAPYRKAAP
ncbi:TetR/AcrR family transcriptional regulator [Streptomyces antimicrobicus]|uniref:TetR/AcrR family transcriptional regulator n=1 Tax=Streptomyces antimicrobicus TaxID=2883108 RepID=A0ABS8B1G4_9ACTN|nr:TetR/AcrR family transcriptional regulator [Streptomyces antimicrobicus]MCB5178448.1 TetR/AcrR family transcriptional regulator [Streptomyces antimicrobicus]